MHVAPRPTVDFGKNMTLGAELSPVTYFTEGEFASELNAVVANIAANQEFLQSIDPAMLQAQLHAMLVSAMVCLKHEGFHEEREWRVIHSPARHPGEHIHSSIEVIGGLPQRVYKVPLRSDTEAGLTGLNPSEMIDRIIIGPTQYPFAMFDALVLISQIPVRT